MNRLFIALCLIIAAASARADVTGLISNLIVAAATESELDETVISENILVVNASDYHDLRVGDGLTPGGVRICRTDALTAPPPSYPYSLSMNGNAINLNGSYAIGAEGPLWYLRCNGSNVISVLANAASLGSILSRAVIDADTLRIIVGVEDSALDPLVQYSPSIREPVWTDCVYSVTSPSPNTVQIDISIVGLAGGYYRITALTGFRVRFGIPLEAPVATFGDGVVVGTSGREIKRTLSTDALALEGGDNWDTGAFLELGGDDSTGEVSGGSAQLILRNTSSRFRVRERQSWNDALEVYGDGRVVMSGATFIRSGTNMLLIINNVTNLVNLTPQ